MCKMQYMKARLVVATREVRDDGSIVEIIIWAVPEPVPPCAHGFKYSLLYGFSGRRLVGYDNERGKGDHRHWKETEAPYPFSTLEQLLSDFETDIANIGDGR